jgi:hypothetical protein
MQTEIMQLNSNLVNWIKSQKDVFTLPHHLIYQLQKAVNKLLNPLVPELYATQNVKEPRILIRAAKEGYKWLVINKTSKHGQAEAQNLSKSRLLNRQNNLQLHSAKRLQPLFTT